MPTTYNHSDSDAHLHVFSSPIQRLCPEILAEIFTFCIPDVTKDFRHISSWNAPLLLCSVCSLWRSLAISTRRLWQTFHFRLVEKYRFEPIDTEFITSGIRTWLDRSGALPLSIRVVFWIKDQDPDIATARRLILEVLLQEVSRWEMFEMYDEEICHAPPHFGILPMLHTLALGSSIDGVPFTAAPCLKKLYLISLPDPTPVSAIPWNQLVEITIIQKIQPISMVVAVIQCCPRLESLSLHVKEGYSSSTWSIIQHDTLWRLHLDVRSVNANGVFGRLILPALTDLSLWGSQCNNEFESRFSRSSLVNFFTRSSCRLQKFEFHCFGFRPGDFLEYLCHQSCQTLTQLVIQGDKDFKDFIPMVNSNLLIRLTYPDGDGDATLCPQLRHLTLNYCYCSDKSFPGVLGRMIQSRCLGRAQNAQLRSLQLRDIDSLSKEDDELLQFARSNYGLEFSYYYGNDYYRRVINNPTWLDVF
ncbi:hypothetical protein JOM56_013246 [Amanita muscaria]